MPDFPPPTAMKHAEAETPAGFARPILLAITGLETGGAEQCLVRLALAISQQNRRVIVVSLRPPPVAPRDRLPRELQAAGVPVRYLNCRSPWQLPRAVKGLRKIIRAENPSLVHSFLYHANLVAAMAMIRLKTPVVWGQRVIEQGWFRRKLLRSYAQRIARIVCVSDDVARFAEQSLKIPHPRISVVANGVEIRAASRTPNLDQEGTQVRASLGVSPARRLLVCVGRLEPQKGFDLLIDWLAASPQILAEHDLVIVGEGKQCAALQAQIESRGLAQSIRLVGWRDDVRAIMQASDAVLIPSRWEGMPNVLLEAMSLALPVVATDVQGVRQVLGPLVASPLSALQLSPRENGPRFIAQLQSLLQLPYRGRGIGEQNQQRVRAEFSWPAQMERYLALLNDTLASESL